MTRFELNGRPVEFDGDPQMPLLWYLREHVSPHFERIRAFARSRSRNEPV
jgi:aerobic-type carbon monoxide dehydrogenase small subunit (CoxS/CutS family)